MTWKKKRTPTELGIGIDHLKSLATDVNWTCDDHFTIYTNIESLCCTPETNRMVLVNCISIKTILKILTKYTTQGSS